jgi:hypothetical protein
MEATLAPEKLPITAQTMPVAQYMEIGENGVLVTFHVVQEIVPETVTVQQPFMEATLAPEKLPIPAHKIPSAKIIVQRLNLLH